MEPVKISSLELENVKRIRAVQIQPTKDGLTVIGGRNGQGKTSVLDAIAWALGGNKLKPDNPNRDGGATPAKLHVELSNGIVVERRGKNGTLYVTDQTGMKGTQKLLDEFLSHLALDLPKFLGGTDKDRTTALLQTLGIDDQLAALDGQIRSTYQERQLVGQDAKRLRAHADKLPQHSDVPAEPVSVAELVRQQQEILARNGENQRKREKVEQIKYEYDRTAQSESDLNDRIAYMLEQVEKLKSDLTEVQKRRASLGADLVMAKTTAEQLQDESTAEIEASIADIESVNARVADNQRKAEAVAVATKREAEYADMTATLEDLRDRRTALLDGAPLPLPGLSVNEDGRLTYNGQTWSDMSSSEQLRVATAIVRATKPDCGFVLVDKLEQLDPQTLAEFGTWAQGEGLQVIGTRVGTDDSCTVVIEDGKVEGQDMADPVAPDPKGEAIPWGSNHTTPKVKPSKTWGGDTF